MQLPLRTIAVDIGAADGISKFNFQDLIWQSKNGEDHCYKEHIGFVMFWK